ncbi:MAG: hypothetical protein ACJ78G_03980 [Gemmatimonadaceae bacterium]
MQHARFRLMASLAGATLCLFAATAYSQNPTTTNAPTATPGTATPDAQATGDATTQPNATTAAPAPQTATPSDNGTSLTTTATDVTTSTETARGFPGGFWGIVAVAVLVLLVLFALLRGRDRTVVRDRDTYVASNTSRTVGTGTAVGDRNLNPRTASGTDTTPGGMNEPPPRA